MKHLFLDTNVIIDFLANRQPFSLEAAKLFDYSLSQKVTLYVSAVSYNNIYYIVKQFCPPAETIKILNELYDLTETIDVSKNVISKALKSEFKDFEDAIQYQSAISVRKIDCIVTRNTKDFKKSTLPTLTPKEALTMVDSATR